MMKKPVDHKVYGGYTVAIYRDELPASPRLTRRNWTEMLCFRPFYNLGDAHTFPNARVAEEYAVTRGNMCLPLYFLEGISRSRIRTTPFKDVYSSSQVGWAVMNNRAIMRYIDCHPDLKPEDVRTAINDLIRREVATYDAYVRGDNFGFVLFRGKRLLTSRWGFAGTDHEESGLMPMAAHVISLRQRSIRHSHAEKLKAWIRNGVPIANRKPMPLEGINAK